MTEIRGHLTYCAKDNPSCSHTYDNITNVCDNHEILLTLWDCKLSKAKKRKPSEQISPEQNNSWGLLLMWWEIWALVLLKSLMEWKIIWRHRWGQSEEELESWLSIGLNITIRQGSYKILSTCKWLDNMKKQW